MPVKLRCEVCHDVIIGKPVRYANRNFCDEKHKHKWEGRQATQMKVMECGPSPAHSLLPGDNVGAFDE